MIKVIEPGLYSNIQDFGRFGYRNIGVPYSGFMDQESARTANKIVGNDENESLIEITLMGPTLLFNADYILSITGADFSSLINNDKEESLMRFNNIHTGQSLNINEGKSEITLTIENFPIYKEGVYFFNLYFGDASGDYEILENVFSIEVLATDVFNSGRLLEVKYNKIIHKNINLKN